MGLDIMKEKESDIAASAVLPVLISNYLSLGQFALARAALRNLNKVDSEKAFRLLRTLIEHEPPDHWLESDAIPNVATLTWLCVGEYRALVRQPLKPGHLHRMQE